MDRPTDEDPSDDADLDRDDTPDDADPDESDLDAGGDDDEVGDDEPAATRAEGRGAPRRRSPIDARALMVAVLVALIAALLAGLVTRAIIAEDEPTDVPGGLTEAREVPDVALERLTDGSEVSLTDYRGQPMVVNFWGSWCAPCVEEMPDLQRVHESLGDDVAFVGVNVRDQEDAALELAEETGVTYELVRDPDGELIREMGITTFPTTVLVLPDGTVVDVVQRKISAERLCEKINQSLLAGGLDECG